MAKIAPVSEPASEEEAPDLAKLTNDLGRARSEAAQLAKILAKVRAEMERERRLKDIARRQREIANDEAMRLKVDLDITTEALKMAQDRLSTDDSWGAPPSPIV